MTISSTRMESYPRGAQYSRAAPRTAEDALGYLPGMRFDPRFAAAVLGTTIVTVSSAMGCAGILGLDEYKECSTADCGSGGAGTASTTGSMSTSTAGACPTLTLVGEADRTMTVGDEAMVTVMVDGVADSIEWTQTGGPPIALPAAGATSFTYEPPYVHDTFALRATAKKAGCADSAADVTLTPVAKGVGVYVAPPPLGVDGAAGDAAHPLARIDEAMSKAQGAPIYVAAGEYVHESYVAPSDVQIYGGYAPGPVWHRAHKTNVSKLTMPHAYASTVFAAVKGFDCRSYACTLGGLTIAQTIESLTAMSKGVSISVFVGAGGATIYENSIIGPGLPSTEGYGSWMISDTEDVLDENSGGAGPLNIFSNRLDTVSGATCIGIVLRSKAGMLDPWTIANNFISVADGLDESVGIYASGGASMVGNTVIVSAKAGGAGGLPGNYFGNVFRAASGNVLGGLGCEGTGDVIDYNSVFGFKAEIQATCNPATHLLTVDPLVSQDGRLQVGSPAIDYAPFTNPAADLLPPWDIDGDLRRQGAGLDLGCDEVK